MFKRADGLQTGNIAEDVKCTLLEYGMYVPWSFKQINGTFRETEDVVVRKEYDEDDTGRAKKREREAEAVKDLKVVQCGSLALRASDRRKNQSGTPRTRRQRAEAARVGEGGR